MNIVFLNRHQPAFSGRSLHEQPLSPVQARMIYVAEALAGAGHEVSIFCAYTGAGDVFNGVSYQSVRHLTRYARQQSIDFLIVVDDEGALKLGIKARFTLAWVHREFPELWHEAPDKRADLMNTLQQRADKVIVMSQWQAECLHQHLGLEPGHFQVLPTDVLPLVPFPKTSPSSVIEIAYSAASHNGLATMLRLFRILEDRSSQALVLHIYMNPQAYGLSTQEETALQDSYADFGIPQTGSIHLHQPCAIAERFQAIARHDLWVYPHEQGQPFAFAPAFWMDAESACLEMHGAQAAGLPVLVGNRGGVSEHLPGVASAQALLEAGEEAKWLSQCLTLIENSEHRLVQAQHQLDYAAAHYTADCIVSQWNAFFEQCVSSRDPQRVVVSAFAEPQISVVIPTYNRARNLRFCLEALTTQTHSAFEVIVCDDGSQDHTREVVADFRERLNLRYRWQEDRGFRAAEARNLGIRLARGKYVVFLDSDVVVGPEFLVCHQQALEAHPQSAVNAYVYRMQAEIDDDLGLPPAEYIPRHRDILKPDSRDRYHLFERGTPIEETYFLDSNAMSMRRKDLDKIGFFDGSFVGWGHEDTELGYRLAQYGMTLVLIKDAATCYHLYHYVSDTKADEKQHNWLRLTQKYGITQWYEPLWELTVLTAVTGKGLDPEMELSARWSLKTGMAYPVVNNPLTLHVEDGILTRIEAFSLPTFFAEYKSEK